MVGILWHGKGRLDETAKVRNCTLGLRVGRKFFLIRQTEIEKERGGTEEIVGLGIERRDSRCRCDSLSLVAFHLTH